MRRSWGVALIGLMLVLLTLTAVWLTNRANAGLPVEDGIIGVPWEDTDGDGVDDAGR